MNEAFEYNDVDELRKIIKILSSKLQLLEDSKKAICNMILKEKELLYCPKCKSTKINKNGKYKDFKGFIISNSVV